MWRGLMAAVSMLLATAGAGFLLFAGYVALRQPLGPALAAVVMAAGLLLAAAVLLVIAGRSNRTGLPEPAAAPPLTAAPPVAVSSADAAGRAAFTTAFVVGRYLTDRR